MEELGDRSSAGLRVTGCAGRGMLGWGVAGDSACWRHGNVRPVGHFGGVVCDDGDDGDMDSKMRHKTFISISSDLQIESRTSCMG